MSLRRFLGVAALLLAPALMAQEQPPDPLDVLARAQARAAADVKAAHLVAAQPGATVSGDDLAGIDTAYSALAAQANALAQSYARAVVDAKPIDQDAWHGLTSGLADRVQGFDVAVARLQSSNGRTRAMRVNLRELVAPVVAATPPPADPAATAASAQQVAAARAVLAGNGWPALTTLLGRPTPVPSR